MTRIAILEEKVRALYEEKNPKRASWADWLYKNHVFLVAEEAKRLGNKYNANTQVVEAAAMLHDIADTVMQRADSTHETKSLEIAKQFLKEADFPLVEIEQIITDILPNHGCYPGHFPKTLEGKLMATADAIVHILSDFYHFSLRELRKTMPEEEVCEWFNKKLNRDFKDKIFFDDERKRISPKYKSLKNQLNLPV